MEKIQFVPDGESEAVAFYVLDQARLSGRNYLLVTDVDPEKADAADGEALGTAYVMKDIAAPDDEESVYEFVEEEQELSAICVLFQDALQELGIELEE